MKKIKSLYFLFAAFLLISFHSEAQEKITVDAGLPMDSSVKFMQGFLHGGPLFLDSVAVAKLKPAFWRIGTYDGIGGGYDETKRFNPQITLVINDLYMIAYNIPSQTQSQPWTGNWHNWDTLVYVLVNASVVNNKPVDYWDVWGEPDNFWTGTYGDWIEMYRRTDSIIHSIIPNAKITGPEFGFGSCNFSAVAILDFLDSLHSVNAAVDGISWHEMCNPEDIPAHVQQVRDSLALRPWASNMLIHIPEYAGPANHIIPGWNVGWLYNLEESKVNWSSHACWNETDGNVTWSDCQYGLNGLFMNDNVSPQPNYWVHRAYAELNGTRISTSHSHLKTIALANRNDSIQEMKILAGRYDNPNLGFHNAPANVEIKIKNYPYGNNATMPLVIQRIPSNNVAHSIPLFSPATVFTGTVTFTGDSASIFLNGFIDGDAYIVYINPGSNSVLGQEEISIPEHPYSISVYPNPANETITILNPYHQQEECELVNALGQIVKTITISETSQLNISDLPAGMYFLRVKGENRSLKIVLE